MVKSLENYVNRRRVLINQKIPSNGLGWRRIYSIYTWEFWTADQLSMDIAQIQTLGSFHDENGNDLPYSWTLPDFSNIKQKAVNTLDGSIIFAVTRNDQDRYAIIQLRVCSGKVVWFTQDVTFGTNVPFYVRAAYYPKASKVDYDLWKEGVQFPVSALPGDQINPASFDHAPMFSFQLSVDPFEE